MKTREDLTEQDADAVLRELEDELASDPATADCAGAVRSARDRVARRAVRMVEEQRSFDAVSSQIYPFA